MSHRKSRVLILGSGPAGYTAGIYAARAGLQPILLTGQSPGGQLTITSEVENFPGFAQPVQGPWLMSQMRDQAERVGVQVIDDGALAADLSRAPFCVTAEQGVYEGQTLIIATGARARSLGLPSEEALRGAGVSACAVCDGFFFRERAVAVVGGGNTAVEEALYLTRHARQVWLIHRRDTLRAERILLDRIAANPRINVIWNAEVEEILGSLTPVPGVTGVRLRDVRTRERRELALDGVFVAIGHDPASGLFRNQLDLDPCGYIRIGAWSTATSIRGVYAAGDVADPRYRQAVTASAMGCMAALEAEHHLAGSPALEAMAG